MSEKKSHIPGNPSKFLYNFEKNDKKVQFTYKEPAHPQGKILKNRLTLGLDAYEPEDPRYKGKSMKEVLSEFEIQNNYMPRIVAHNLMHWYENHTGLNNFESLMAEGIKDFMVIFASLPNSKEEAGRIADFAVKFFLSQNLRYLNKSIIDLIEIDKSTVDVRDLGDALKVVTQIYFQTNLVKMVYNELGYTTPKILEKFETVIRKSDVLIKEFSIYTQEHRSELANYINQQLTTKVHHFSDLQITEENKAQLIQKYISGYKQDGVNIVEFLDRIDMNSIIIQVDKQISQQLKNYHVKERPRAERGAYNIEPIKKTFFEKLKRIFK